MGWGNVIESAIGTSIGGAIALGSMWIKELIDRRKAAQVWYEQYYITEGIDRLLSHVRIMDLQLATLVRANEMVSILRTNELYPGVEKSLKSEAHEAFPLEALVRLETLLDDSLITAVITTSQGVGEFMKNMPPMRRSTILIASAIQQLRNLYGHLRTIRAELLKVEIKQKSDIKDIHKRPSIKQVLAQLDESNTEWLAKTIERDQAISQEQ
jgi:hypothetical protein